MVGTASLALIWSAPLRVYPGAATKDRLFHLFELASLSGHLNYKTIVP